MKEAAKHIERFFLSNTSWVFFTTILLLCYVMMVESGQYTWQYYYSYVLSASLLFLPVLIFSGYRSLLKEKPGKAAYRIMWAIIFLGWPVLLMLAQAYWREQLFILPPKGQAVPPGFIKVAGIALFLTEAGIQTNNYFRRHPRLARWLPFRKNLLPLVLILAAALGAAFTFRPPANAFAGGFSGFIEKIPVFFSYTFQFLLILLAYSFYYFINRYLLVPVLLKKKGILYFGFGIAGAILVFYPLLALAFGWLPVVRNEEALFYPEHEIFPSDRGGLPFLIILLSAPLIVGMEWYKQASELAELEKERATAELNSLRQQFNPHFFFNTLNNLYALSLTGDKQTPEAILHLSELMRYVIYKGKEDSVSLAEEVKYIEDYVRLWQIRLHKPFDFRFEKELAGENLHLPPLLFITLVENAFKHGIEPAEGPCFLHLRLESGRKGLLFSCTNSFEGAVAAGGGLGLNNLARRLELLFPGQHKFMSKPRGRTYYAILKLPLWPDSVP